MVNYKNNKTPSKHYATLATRATALVINSTFLNNTPLLVAFSIIFLVFKKNTIK